MLAFLSYLRQIRRSTRQADPSCSSNQEIQIATAHIQDSLQPDNNSSSHSKIPEDHIQRLDSYSNLPKLTGTKRPMDSDHTDNINTKRNRTATMTSNSTMTPISASALTPTLAPASALTPTLVAASASALAKRQITTTNTKSPSSLMPSIPQVFGRAAQLPSYRKASCKLAMVKSGVSTRQKAHSKKRTHRSQTPPYWHRPRRLLFLALKNHPKHEMSRTDLLKAAVALDASISITRNLPLVFRSKTPRNSASAILTNHDGKNFQSFRPCGSRCLHFRLPFKPANFDEAVATYRSWMEILITQDWPLCFGKPRQIPIITTSSSSHRLADTDQPTTVISTKKSPHHDRSLVTTVLDAWNASTSSPMFTPSNTEFDYFLATRKKERHSLLLLNHNDDDDRNKENQVQDLLLDVSIGQGTVGVKGEEKEYTMDMVDDGDNKEYRNRKASQQQLSISETIHWTICGDPSASLDQPNIPTSWKDIVRVEGGFDEDEADSDSDDEDQSGFSVFAQRQLPANTPIGFYFGTPTTEEEFDAYKENYIQAILNCVMYDNMVLDATDDYGLPFTDPAEEDTKIYCPFHFMRQVESPQSANVILLKGNVYNQVICWTKQTIDRNEELTICLERRR